MTDYLVTPDQTIDIAGQPYTLDGSFKTLKDIQHAMGEEILSFLRTRATRLGFDDIARIITIGITNAKMKPPASDVIEQYIVDEMGIVVAREKVFVWLVVASTPKVDRQKKAEELAEMLKPKPKDP